MRPKRDWVGARASIALTGVAALLSIATGLANIGATAEATGPLVDIVPEVVILTAGFTGTLTGFLLLVSDIGLRRGFRAAWYTAVVLLPLTAIQGLLQAWTYSYPLVVVSLLALVVLLVNRRRFTRKLELGSTQIAAIAAIVAAQAYGTFGTFALRDSFNGVESLTDAYYFTLVTGSTVGYGDITATTEFARLFAMSTLILNVSSFAVALGVVLTPAIEAKLSQALGRMTESQLELLDDHILVLGCGDLTEPIIDELVDAVDCEFVVITPDEQRTRQLTEENVEVLRAEPSDEASLRRAQIDSARAILVATEDDGDDALSILSARQVNPNVRIVAAASQRENVGKLKRAGADNVISPAVIGSRLLVRSAMGSDDSEDIADRLIGEDSLIDTDDEDELR